MKSGQFYNTNMISVFNIGKSHSISRLIRMPIANPVYTAKLSVLTICLFTACAFPSAIYAYSDHVVNGQHEQDLVIADGGIQVVGSGGETTHITIDNGTQQIDGGIANNTIINAGAMQNVVNGTANGSIINSGGVQSVNNQSTAIGSQIQDGGTVNVNQNAHVDNVTVYNNGTLNVNNKSLATNIILNGGQVIIKDNSTLRVADVNAGGVLIVELGSTGRNIIINPNGQFYANGEVDMTTIAGGTQFVNGITNNTYINAGTQVVNVGGIADINWIQGGSQIVEGLATNTTIKEGTQTVNAGGKANVTNIMNQGVQVVNGMALNTTINAGMQTINQGGIANITTISGGTQVVSGQANNTTIKLGSQTVNNDGIADNTKILGGAQIVNGIATNTTISSGTQTINRGGTADINKIEGGRQIVDGFASNTTIRTGTQNVSLGGRADKTMMTGGSQVVDGFASNTTINGGLQIVNVNGSATNTSINNNGTQRVYGSALGSIVKQSGIMHIYDGATIKDTSAYHNGFIIMDRGAQSLGSLSIYDNARVVLVAGKNTQGAADSGGYAENINLYQNGLLAISPSTNLPGETYITVGNVNNAGVIRFSTEEKMYQPHILNILGNYTGNSGFIHFNGTLNNDESPIDKLIISGNTAGTTYVTVNNIGGYGAQTVKGINLIRVDGVSAGNFVQNGAIQIGAYEYNLVRSPIDSKNWVLKSQQARDGKSVLVPDAGVYLANLYVANSLFNLSLHDRLGETSYTDLLTGETKVTSMWIRARYGYSKFRAGESQLKIKNDWNMTQLGGDIATWTDNLQRLHLGLMAGYAYSSNTSTSDETDMHSTSKLDGYSYGLYGTWYSAPSSSLGWYVDTWAQWNSFKAVVDSKTISSHYHLKGVSASVESGYTFNPGEIGRYNLFIEPQIQGIWQGTKPKDLKQSNGARVSSTHNNLLMRLGVRTELRRLASLEDSIDQSGQLFLEMSWLYNSRLPSVTFNETTDVQQDGSRNIAEFKMGVEGYVTKNTNIWFNIASQFGDDSFRKVSMLFGVKYSY